MHLPVGSVTPEHRIRDWIDITDDGRVTVHSGKVELGQGITAALIGVVSTELGIDPDRVNCPPPSTQGPDEGYTAGSLSMTMSGTALRLAARALRRVTQTLDGEPMDLASVESAHLDRCVLEVVGEAAGERPPVAMPRREVPRADLVAKVTGQPAFIHDLRLDGQVFGRIIRRSGHLPVADSVDLHDPEVLAHPEFLAVVSDGAFLGVVARREHAAIVLAARIESGIDWVSRHDESDRELSEGPEPTILHVADHPAGAVRHQLRVTRPHLLHASIGPACAIARWDDSASSVHVWTHSQGVHPLRRELARALSLDPSMITVEHSPGAGCYGHNGADDVAYDAVLLARSMPGLPVHVTWSRTQDLSCGPAGPAMEVDVAAETDESGRITAWEWSGSGEGHVCRPGMVAGIALVAHGEITGGQPVPASADPDLAIGGGIARNARPVYDLPLRYLASNLRLSPIRTSAIRSLGAFLNVIATEALMDDIARTHDIDAVEFRLAHLTDERAVQVLLRAVELSGDAPTADAHGRGIGLARYKGTGAWCAVVADVECIDRVRVTRLVVVADVGQIANRDGVLHQLQGGALQSLSWTLQECAPVRNGSIDAAGWGDYPIARFTNVPPVLADVMERPGEPYLGAGEAAAGPTAAAIVNAVAAALGVRVRDLPLTPASIEHAIR